MTIRTSFALASATAVIIMLAVSGTPGLATVFDAYWAGTVVEKGDVNGGHNHAAVDTTFGGGWDVAIDKAQGKIFWADNSSGVGQIMSGNLSGGGKMLLLTAPGFVWQLQIDAGMQTLYWADFNANRIYWTPTNGTPSVNTLPLSPQTLRAFALDLRVSKRHLYYIDDFDVWRSDLAGANLAKLPNPLWPGGGAPFGGVFGGLAIDTCSEQLIATAAETAPNLPAAIVRADLANAGNVTPLLLSTPTVGLEPRKIMLDLNVRKMYWTVNSDYGIYGRSTVRRADLNGTNMEVLAKDMVSTGTFSGMGLDLAQTDCTTVGVNKDLQNNTGQIANDIEILIEGTYTNVAHYDGYPANQFASFTEAPDGNGNTLLSWSNPNNVVQPGQIAHVGFNLPGSSANILSVTWTRDGVTTGCPQQISTNTHAWGSPGSQVVYANNVLQCAPIPRYVGGLVVEWHARPVALADLNPRVHRRPIRTDTIRRDPIRLRPKATATVTVPTAPRNAVSGVIVYKVSTNARLTGRDVTTDFVQFPVNRNRQR
jgi:hypothetical protein